MLELYTIALSGLGGDVMPTKTRDACAEVVTSSGSPKSGAQVTLILTVEPEDDGQLYSAHVGVVSPNGGSTGSDGRLNFEFKAPTAGGLHTTTVTCATCTNSPVTGTIRVPGCPVDDLPPIADPEAQLFEDNPDRSDETRLTDRMKEALACLKRDAVAGSPNVGSAYRPPAYNQHLIDVWEKWDELKDNTKPACAALKTKIQGHFKTHKHKESQGSVPGSRHTLGEAVDVTISLPPATIDAFWPGCHLYRPPSLRITDPVHFIY